MTRDTGKEDRVFLITGVFLIICEVLKQIALTFITGGGRYIWWYFPWQLCSVPMYFCVAVYICGRKKAYGIRGAFITFLADFTLLSGAAAFLDTSGFSYDIPALTVYSYIWHILLIITGIFAGTRPGDKTLKAFFPAAGIYLLAAAAAEVINLGLYRFGTINMFYISPHYKMGQIVFAELAEFLPNTFVIMLYILATLTGGFLVHAVWWILAKRIASLNGR